MLSSTLNSSLRRSIKHLLTHTKECSRTSLTVQINEILNFFKLFRENLFFGFLQSLCPFPLLGCMYGCRWRNIF